MIRLPIPSIEEEYLAAVSDVLVSGYLVQGSVVAASFPVAINEHPSDMILPEKVMIHRADIIDSLKMRGIETTIDTWHLLLTSYLRIRYGYQTEDFPVTDQVFVHHLTLPLHDRLLASE